MRKIEIGGRDLPQSVPASQEHTQEIKRLRNVMMPLPHAGLPADERSWSRPLSNSARES